MDGWHRGRIVHAYLIWLLFKATAVSGFAVAMQTPVREVVVEAGKNHTLNCPEVNENTMVSELEWRANGQRILAYSNEITTSWKSENRVTLSTVNYALHFQPVEASDSADYECLANRRNTPDEIIRLIVQDVPDPPGQPMAVPTSSTTANLSWAPGANSHNKPILHYIIESQIGENSTWNGSAEFVTPTNATKFTVTKLKPFTVYKFRVSAVNAMGRSKPSKDSFYMMTLRNVPEGTPTIVQASNNSATSIFLTWIPPSLDTIHGEFLGYRLSYRLRDNLSKGESEIYIRNATATKHVIHNLETYTQYLVSLQVFNPEGLGPTTSVPVMTDEAAPTKPLNLTSRGITSTTIELSWIAPVNANGILVGYFVYYVQSNYTDVQMHRTNSDSGPVIEFVLTELKPDTEYKIWVKAYTLKYHGEPSDHILRQTDVMGPNAPTILNLTCQTHDSIYLLWARPTNFSRSIDYYYINYRIDNTSHYDQIQLIADKDHLETGTIISNLTTNTVYEIVVRGATRSVLDSKLIIQGENSIPQRVQVTRGCRKIPPLMQRHSREFSPGVIAGMVCACFAVMLLITSFVLWNAYYFLDYPPRTVPTLQEWENSEQDGEKTAVAIQQFVQHVASLHADGDIGFNKEYESIQAENGEFTAENSQYAENKPKNRYSNILAYDHTRVQLLSCGGGPPKKGNDYVNANYIDGWQRPRAYIGTQGPLPPTFDGFWRMVWEQRVSIVVMITNLVERSRRKCDMYWPKEGSETYGFIQVTLLKEDVMSTYTIRTLQVRHLKIKKKKNGTSMGERIIWQYHYTGWPDHGVPEHPLPVLSFIRKSSNANPPEAGPIIVHCSAGVGRTGAYIVIDAMLKQAKSKGEINVFGFLKHIRTQRNFLVQIEEQYIFIHDALQEAIESGETNIDAKNLIQHIQDMLTPANNKTEAWCNLEAQYKLVTSWKPKDFNLVSATKPCNVDKNRNSEIIPIETARVHLTSKPGVEGSDYVNATWISGFHRNREFIITQHPMENTIMEFWQMMWDHNVRTVVMLTQCNEEYPEFWPTERNDIESETFLVRSCGIKHPVNGIVIREVAVRSLQDDYELSAKIIHGPLNQAGLGWPHNDNPRTFVNFVYDLHRDYQNGPILVMDRFGGVEAAVFVLLITLNKQLEFEKSADIYMYSKLLYMKRPGVFRSKEDYVLLYQCLESILSPKDRGEPDLYAMTNGHVSSMAETSEVIPTTSMQPVATDYGHKAPVVHEYATVEMNSEYLADYRMPIRGEHPLEPSSSRSSDTYLPAHTSGTELEKSVVMAQRNVSYHNHPAGISVTVDANGYITNGNMRLPPEGREPSCKMLPQ